MYNNRNNMNQYPPQPQYQFNVPPPNFPQNTPEYNPSIKPPPPPPPPQTTHRMTLPPPVPHMLNKTSATPPRVQTNSPQYRLPNYQNNGMPQNFQNNTMQQNFKENVNLPIINADLQSIPPPVIPYVNGLPKTVSQSPNQNYYTGYQANRYTNGSAPSYPTSPLPQFTPPPPAPPATFYASPTQMMVPPPVNNHYQKSPTPFRRNTTYFNKRRENNEKDLRPNYYKRKSEVEADHQRKNTKKRKKPLSQNIPQRKDWSVEDARRAIDIEREYNKRNKSHSLIIKFPDAELNRDIVSKFHSSIESVHFQQPSTPRFCFVSLKEDANPEAVIQALNKTPFGNGLLTAEYKKDRDDEVNIGPEDIDPLTLYVGNLAQEVIKEDMVKIFPNYKRVDIGFAKKMKYTRYAFISFKNVEESIEAFKANHARLLYSKSLIVRFRRLHGTVGMSGEPKLMTPVRTEPEPNQDTNTSTSIEEHPWDAVDVSKWVNDAPGEIINADDSEEDEEEDYEEKPSPFLTRLYPPGSILDVIAQHKPIQVKKELMDEEYREPENGNRWASNPTPDTIDTMDIIKIKEEPSSPPRRPSVLDVLVANRSLLNSLIKNEHVSEEQLENDLINDKDEDFDKEIDPEREEMLLNEEEPEKEQEEPEKKREEPEQEEEEPEKEDEKPNAIFEEVVLSFIDDMNIKKEPESCDEEEDNESDAESNDAHIFSFQETLKNMEKTTSLGSYPK